MFKNMKELADAYEKTISINNSIADCMEGIMEVFRGSDELVELQDELHYGQVISGGSEFFDSISILPHGVSVTYKYVDFYDGYDSGTAVEIPNSWLDLYLEGKYEELLSVVISQQKKLIVVQDKSRLQDLEKMAGHMGYALVKKV
tara:strand:+ start:161 stop:595 length:435 start_codon:yes stop_codon:yes gene_type:complete